MVGDFEKDQHHWQKLDTRWIGPGILTERTESYLETSTSGCAKFPYVAMFSVCASVFWGYGQDLQSSKFPAYKPTILCSSCHISQLLMIPSSSSLSSLNPTSNSLLNRLSIPGLFGLPGTSSSRRPSSSSSSPSRLSPLNLLFPCEIDGRRSQEGIWERKYVEER